MKAETEVNADVPEVPRPVERHMPDFVKDNPRTHPYAIRAATEQIQAWRAHIKEPLHVIADIGANVGVYSVTFALAFPEAQVYAFEPIQESVQLLRLHIKNNGLEERITVVPSAVGRGEGTVRLGKPTPEHDSGWYSREYREHPGAILCPSLSLDHWFYNKMWPNLLKIDVEGYEASVFRGARKCLDQATYVCVEIYKGSQEDKKYILECLQEHKFREVPELSGIVWSPDRFFEKQGG